jgi:hypothetical protein
VYAAVIAIAPPKGRRLLGIILPELSDLILVLISTITLKDGLTLPLLDKVAILPLIRKIVWQLSAAFSGLDSPGNTAVMTRKGGLLLVDADNCLCS